MVSDEYLKDLVYAIVIDTWPGWGVINEVLWDNTEGIEDMTEAEQEELLDRLGKLIRTARVNIFWANEVNSDHDS